MPTTVAETIDVTRLREIVRTALAVLRERPRPEVSPSAAVNSFEAEALRAEIIAAGRKLWQRQYVDGNGGNISARLNSSYVLCTPTMLSKCDLQPADICLTDLEGNVLAGDRLMTSELFLHLAIYRANPRARAVVHCHPPHATAFAITRTAPPSGYLSEYEIFIGPVAVAPYETTGTQAFAETVLPYVHDHNTILLSNHGVVCWSDTVTHAEWLTEILEAYCKTLLIARQLDRPLAPIPGAKLEEILAIKRRLGLPDARLGSEAAETPAPPKSDAEVDSLVDRVLERLDLRA